MSDRMTAVEACRGALSGGDANAVAGHLADDVVVETNFGRAEGAEAALALLAEPRTAGLPAAAPFGGLEFVFTFAGAKIARVEQQTLPAAPVKAMPLLLTDEIKGAVNG